MKTLNKSRVGLFVRVFFPYFSSDLALKSFREMHVTFCFGLYAEISTVKLHFDSLSVLQWNMHLSELLVRFVAKLPDYE